MDKTTWDSFSRFIDECPAFTADGMWRSYVERLGEPMPRNMQQILADHLDGFLD